MSEASLEADYRVTTQELQLDISSEAMTIAAIRTHAARLPAPLLQALSSDDLTDDPRAARATATSAAPAPTAT